MLGKRQGFTSKLIRHVYTTTFRKVVRIWCAAHMLDLICEDKISSVNKGKTYEILCQITSYLRQQYGLQREMRKRAPLLSFTRWLSIGKSISFFVDNYLVLEKYMEDKNYCNRPGKAWWLSIFLMSPFISALMKLFEGLQSRSLTLNDQKEKLRKFIEVWSHRFGVKGPLDSITMENMVNEFAERQEDLYVHSEKFFWPMEEAFNYGCGCCHFSYLILANEEYLSYAEKISVFALNLRTMASAT